MTTNKLQIIVLAGLFASIAFAGPEKKSDAIIEAGLAEKKVGIAAPGIEETKAIAEEGFIYGLPLVMSYVANYD